MFDRSCSWMSKVALKPCGVSLGLPQHPQMCHQMCHCLPLGACRGKGEATLHAEGMRGRDDEWQQGECQLKQG